VNIQDLIGDWRCALAAPLHHAGQRQHVEIARNQDISGRHNRRKPRICKRRFECERSSLHETVLADLPQINILPRDLRHWSFAGRDRNHLMTQLVKRAETPQLRNIRQVRPKADNPRQTYSPGARID
jgi:hypothetical protein